jgi:hypothetical protein
MYFSQSILITFYSDNVCLLLLHLLLSNGFRLLGRFDIVFRLPCRSLLLFDLQSCLQRLDHFIQLYMHIYMMETKRNICESP